MLPSMDTGQRVVPSSQVRGLCHEAAGSCPSQVGREPNVDSNGRSLLRSADVQESVLTRQCKYQDRRECLKEQQGEEPERHREGLAQQMPLKGDCLKICRRR